MTTEMEQKKKFNPIAFITDVRHEIAKVTWPTRKETVLTTIMVVVMAVMAGLFFLAVDSALGYTIAKLLKLGA